MNRKKSYLNTGLALLLICLLTLLDRITKNIVVTDLKGHEDIILIRGVLQLRYIENRGAAFGILQNSRVFFIVITLIVLAAATAGFIHYIFKTDAGRCEWLLLTVYALLMAGAIGNLIDRAAHGYVVDFIYFSLIDFPVFNVADIYITCGCILVLLYVLLSDRKS